VAAVRRGGLDENWRWIWLSWETGSSGSVLRAELELRNGNCVLSALLDSMRCRAAGSGVSCKNARGLDEVLAGGGGVGLVGGEGGRAGGVGAGLGLNLVLVPGDCRTLCLALDLTANLLDESSPDLEFCGVSACEDGWARTGLVAGWERTELLAGWERTGLLDAAPAISSRFCNTSPLCSVRVGGVAMELAGPRDPLALLNTFDGDLRAVKGVVEGGRAGAGAGMDLLSPTTGLGV